MGKTPAIKPKLKVGFLVNPKVIEQHSLDLMDAIAENSMLFESPIIITLQHENHSILKNIISIKEAFKTALVHIINKIEIPRVRTNSIYFNYLLIFSASDLLSRRASFNQCSLDSLSDQSIDILINCSSSKTPAHAFKHSLYGVIKNFSDDSNVENTIFLGLLDVLHGSSVSSLSVIKEDSDSRKISEICSGKLMTRSLWHHNRAALLKKRNAFILRFLKNPHVNIALLNKSIYLNQATHPIDKISSFHLVKYFLKVHLKLIFIAFKQKFQISKKFNRWSVAYLSGDGFGANLSSAIEIKNLPGRFFADPFVISHNNRTICFVEDFFYDESKGKISALEIFEDGYQFLGVVLEEQFHLSYPFVFMHEGQIYMIPETSEANEIRLYQAVDFPLVWKFKQVLMENVSAVDTSIFQEGNSWFMLTNICSSSGDDHSSELHIFYSDVFYSDNWRPIKSHNPVIFNSEKARNGGFFELNNKKYRVNQVQGFGHYGKSFSVNLIKNITRDKYEEDCIFEIQPDFREDIISTHHFHTNGKLTVFDYCKYEKISS